MAVFLGVLAAFFFSITFVFNQLMAVDGGDWLWTAALRYLFMLPMFLLIVLLKKNSSVKKVVATIQSNWTSWFLWSQVGFGLFYIPLSFASTLAPGWLVASTWQITIVAGSLIAPFLTKDPELKQKSRITLRELFYFGIILLGIVIIEVQHITIGNAASSFLAFLAVLLAAFCYPLGNRKIMMLNHESGHLNTDERILAMIISSLPSWIICSIIGYIRSGLPSVGQLESSFIVALSSGVIATYLFFYATQMVHTNLKKLATVEATQSLEVVFSLLLGIILLHDALPSFVTVIGLVFVIGGMTLKVVKT